MTQLPESPHSSDLMFFIEGSPPLWMDDSMIPHVMVVDLRDFQVSTDAHPMSSEISVSVYSDEDPLAIKPLRMTVNDFLNVVTLIRLVNGTTIEMDQLDIQKYEGYRYQYIVACNPLLKDKTIAICKSPVNIGSMGLEAPEMIEKQIVFRSVFDEDALETFTTVTRALNDLMYPTQLK